MDMRFVIGAAGFAVAMLLLSNFDQPWMQGFTGVFVGLAVLLIFVAVALFPNLNRGDVADRGKAGGDWSDRIEFDDNGSSDEAGQSWR